MTGTTTSMSAEELLALPDDHQQHELVRGVLITMAPAGSEHSLIEHALYRAMARFLDRVDLGYLFAADAGFILARDPDTVRAPDIAFVRTGRLTDATREPGYFRMAPDLAVEILSPTDSRKEALEKIGEYRAAGTTLVWLVQPRRKSVTAYRRDRDPIELKIGDLLDGEDVLPGFSIPVARLFE